MDPGVAGSKPGPTPTYELKLRRQSGLRPLAAPWGVRGPTDPPGDWRPPVSRLPAVIHVCAVPGGPKKRTNEVQQSPKSLKKCSGRV